jgi:type I restriction enzyme S subunit
MAWEGAYGIVPPECGGCVVSPEFPVFTVHADRILPEIIAVHFRDPKTWRALSGSSTGTNARRRRLHPETLLDYRMPVPSHRIQRGLLEMLPKAAEIGRLHAASATEADSLLPAMLHEVFGAAPC